MSSTQTQTQTQTQSSTDTDTLTSKMLEYGGVFWVTDKENPSSKHKKTEERSKAFFPLQMLGLASPPLPILVIILLIVHHRSIPTLDVFFSIAFPLYLGLANRFRFDNNAKLFALRKKQGKIYPEKPDWFEQNNESWFMNYMLFAATLGVILPIVLQFVAPSAIVQASAPHLYLLVNQIMMEHMVNNPRFHPILQVINPIGFSVYRMATLKIWLEVAYEMLPTTTELDRSDILTWEMLHLLLALSNVMFWTYNTFVMLLLRVLPPCLDQSKFLDADVSWSEFYQLVPVVNHGDATKEVDNKGD